MKNWPYTEFIQDELMLKCRGDSQCFWKDAYCYLWTCALLFAPTLKEWPVTLDCRLTRAKDLF